MGRTQASARTQAAARTQASARSSTVPYRVPLQFKDLGVTRLWDFRTGFAGTNDAKAENMVGTGRMFFKGSTALSSVYAAGKYQADLERASSDFFATVPMVLTNGLTACTWFAWVKQESTGTNRHVLTQFETAGNQRGFQLRMITTDVMEVVLSLNGTASSTYDTSTTFTDTSAWHFLLATYDTTNRTQIYLDKILQPTSLVAGSNPASINSSPVPVMIGANIPSAPVNFFDGLVGICGIAEGTSMTSAQITQLYNITNAIGAYA